METRRAAERLASTLLDDRSDEQISDQTGLTLMDIVILRADLASGPAKKTSWPG